MRNPFSFITGDNQINTQELQQAVDTLFSAVDDTKLQKAFSSMQDMTGSGGLKAPGGLNVTSDITRAVTFFKAASVVATWNVDTSAIRYEAEMDDDGQPQIPAKREVFANRATWENVRPGATIRVHVRGFNEQGIAGAWSDWVRHVVGSGNFKGVAPEGLEVSQIGAWIHASVDRVIRRKKKDHLGFEWHAVNTFEALSQPIFTGQLNAGLALGTYYTSITVKLATGEFKDTGELILTNGNSETQTFNYTGWTLSAGIYTFSMASVASSYTFLAGDAATIAPGDDFIPDSEEERENIVCNPSFDDSVSNHVTMGLSDSTKEWTESAALAEDTYYTKKHHSGKSCCRVCNTGLSGRYLYQTLTLDPDSHYEFSGYYRIVSGATPVRDIDVRFDNFVGSSTVTQGGIYNTGKTSARWNFEETFVPLFSNWAVATWRKFHFRLKTSSDFTTGRLCLGFSGSNTGDVLFDDIRVRKINGTFRRFSFGNHVLWWEKSLDNVYVKVRGVDVNGNTSMWSECCLAERPFSLADTAFTPSAPTAVKVDSTGGNSRFFTRQGNAVLSWTNPTTYTNTRTLPDNEVAGYKVYWIDGATTDDSYNGDWINGAATEKWHSRFIPAQQISFASPTTCIRHLVRGHKYYFRVTVLSAILGSRSESARSEHQVSGPGPTPADVPTLIAEDSAVTGDHISPSVATASDYKNSEGWGFFRHSFQTLAFKQTDIDSHGIAFIHLKWKRTGSGTTRWFHHRVFAVKTLDVDTDLNIIGSGTGLYYYIVRLDHLAQGTGYDYEWKYTTYSLQNGAWSSTATFTSATETPSSTPTLVNLGALVASLQGVNIHKIGGKAFMTIGIDIAALDAAAFISLGILSDSYQILEIKRFTMKELEETDTQVTISGKTYVEMPVYLVPGKSYYILGKLTDYSLATTKWTNCTPLAVTAPEATVINMNTDLATFEAQCYSMGKGWMKNLRWGLHFEWTITGGNTDYCVRYEYKLAREVTLGGSVFWLKKTGWIGNDSANDSTEDFWIDCPWRPNVAAGIGAASGYRINMRAWFQGQAGTPLQGAGTWNQNPGTYWVAFPAATTGNILMLEPPAETPPDITALYPKVKNHIGRYLKINLIDDEWDYPDNFSHWTIHADFDLASYQLSDPPSQYNLSWTPLCLDGAPYNDPTDHRDMIGDAGRLKAQDNWIIIYIPLWIWDHDEANPLLKKKWIGPPRVDHVSWKIVCWIFEKNTNNIYVAVPHSCNATATFNLDAYDVSFDPTPDVWP
jgi:hypothetical protein